MSRFKSWEEAYRYCFTSVFNFGEKRRDQIEDAIQDAMLYFIRTGQSFDTLPKSSYGVKAVQCRIDNIRRREVRENQDTFARLYHERPTLYLDTREDPDGLATLVSSISGCDLDYSRRFIDTLDAPKISQSMATCRRIVREYFAERGITRQKLEEELYPCS